MDRCPVVLLLLLLGGTPAQPANILVATPMPVYSHILGFMPIYKALGERGHQLTVITSFLETPVPKGFDYIYTNLQTKTFIEKIENSTNGFHVVGFNGPTYHMTGLAPWCPSVANILSDVLKPLLPPPETSKFDLIVVEAFFCQEFMVGLSHYYDAPLVVTLAGPMSPHITRALGNPQLFSIVPNIRTPYSDNMDFMERVWNFISGVTEILHAQFISLPYQDKIMRNVFGNKPNLPYISDLYQNISLLLSEVHFSLNYPRPYFKNVVEVGGMAEKTRRPLTGEVKKFLDDAKDGAIYFSWGSHYHDLNPEHTLAILMDNFKKLKQRVLFKWENSTIPNKPPNVFVSTWVPQISVLGHKNVKLFVSHCGINSIYEAALQGVPVVGTSLFGDQHHNIKVLESFGMGLKVDFNKIGDKTTLVSAINKVLADSSFSENAMKRSAILRDRPIPTVDEAAYWMEYVIKYSGGKHLKPHSLNMPWYSVALIDVILFIASLCLLLITSIIYCIRILLRWKRKTRSAISKSKKIK